MEIYKSAEDIAARTFIGKHAIIKTCDKKTHSGYIYVVDPESKSIVLTTKNDEGTNGDLIIITADSIDDITINKNKDIGEVSIHKKDQNKCYTIQDLRLRKQKLKEWLKLNLIDVLEDGEALKFQDHLIIEPPYDLEHCYCTNTIVLDRFRGLIGKMPL